MILIVLFLRFSLLKGPQLESRDLMGSLIIPALLALGTSIDLSGLLQLMHNCRIIHNFDLGTYEGISDIKLSCYGAYVTMGSNYIKWSLRTPGL